MAQIFAQAAGGEIKRLSVSTVKEARAALNLPENYQATVNESVEDDNYAGLEDNDFIAFTVKTKGN